MAQLPLITVCIPAYHPAAYIEGCVRSLRDQTLTDWRCVISNDGGFDREVLKQFENDPAFEVIHHDQRMGWVENTNFLIRRVGSEFFCILPQDDELAPEYLERTWEALDTNRSAIAAFTYSESLWLETGRTSLHRGTSVLGDKNQRIRTVLRDQMAGFSFRSLIRTPEDPGSLALLRNPHFDYAADSTWIMTKAIQGELICVPEALYRKRIYPASTSQTWNREEPRLLLRAWTQHCIQITCLAMRAAGSASDALKYFRMGRLRLLTPRTCKHRVTPEPVSNAMQAQWPTYRRRLIRLQFLLMVLVRLARKA
jgi:Glycosyl transferase family 2